MHNFARSVPGLVVARKRATGRRSGIEKRMVPGTVCADTPRIDKKTIDYNALAMLLQLLKHGFAPRAGFRDCFYSLLVLKRCRAGFPALHPGRDGASGKGAGAATGTA